MQTQPLTPSDLVGCRYRQVQRGYYPDMQPLAASVQRKIRREVGLAEVIQLLPSAANTRSRTPFIRCDINPMDELAEFHTLEAIAARANVITGAVFKGETAGVMWEVTTDILVRDPDGQYLPVMVSNHRVARLSPHQSMMAIATSRLGLGQPVTVQATLRHHTIDGYRLAFAHWGLAAAGAADLAGSGLLIGQDRSWAYIVDISRYAPAAERALVAPAPSTPRRVKECSNCRYWFRCQPELLGLDDISLFLSGDRADSYREKGINTTQKLIDANLGEISDIAAAWRAGIPVLRRTEKTTAPRFDVEVDVDVESYLDLGAYLWGAFDGVDYHPFVVWNALGSEEEAKNFARFWSWLMACREKAQQYGQSFGAFCYSSNGENHWMLSSARRFHGKVIGVPSEAEVRRFIASDQWVDMFAVARSQLIGPGGLGLKQLAPAAGFHWSESDFAGEDSLHAYLIASQGSAVDSATAKNTLLSYNGDDCRATAAVRQWLRLGARSAPVLAQITIT